MMKLLWENLMVGAAWGLGGAVLLLLLGSAILEWGATADNLGAPGWDALYGYGRVDVAQAAAALVPAPAVALRP